MQASFFAKRSLQDQAGDEKQPKLKLDEMIPIFQRLPTSELIRFISNIPSHPLGRFWSAGLKFVVEERLPFSLKSTVANGNNNRVITYHVIYDCNGSKVANIKRPEQFHLSPLCELIEEVELPVRQCTLTNPTVWRRPPRTGSYKKEVDGVDHLPLRLAIPALVNLHQVNLSFWENGTWPTATAPAYGSALADLLTSELMSQLESLSLSTDYTGGPRFFAFNKLADLLSRATDLKKLSVTEGQFFALWTRKGIPTSCSRQSRLTVASVSMTTELANVFAGLESLTIVRGREVASEAVLDFISTRCTNLVELDLPIRGAIRIYFAAFQALSRLTKLGLDAMDSKRNELIVDDNIEVVGSITECCLRLNPYSNDEHVLLAMLSKVPNVRRLEIQGGESHFMLRFASAVCSNRILRQLQMLKCSRSIGPASYKALLQFVDATNAHFPNTVDLSQMQILPVADFRNFAEFSQMLCSQELEESGRELLVSLYLAMESNSVKCLFLRAVIHRNAFDRLREHLSSAEHSLKGAKMGKVLAWKSDESCGVNPEDFPLGPWHVTQFTDFKIDGTKTSGPAKGELFKIRIYHV